MADDIAQELDVSSYVPLQDKYESRTHIVDNILGGGVAAIGDFATSIWNSITPERFNTSTEDLLARIDDNALKIYTENEDTVHTASFVGGMFVPTGLALKGVNLLRSGAKGVSWFSEAGKTAQLTKIEQTLRESGIASAAYKTELRTLYGQGMANMMVDNIAMELALVGTMNAHPFMEDYMKDPAKNFMVSTLLGGAIAGPLTHIGLRYEVKQLGMKAYSEAAGVVARDAQAIDATADISTQISQHQRNVENWEGLLARSQGDTVGIDPKSLTGEMLTSFIQSSKAAQLDLFETIASPAMKEMPIEFKNSLITQMTSQPERFAGINFLDFATAKEEAGLIKEGWNKLRGTTLIEGDIPLTTTVQKGKNKGELRATKMVYSPRFDAFMLREDLQHYSVAADFVQDVDDLTKGMTNGWFRIPNYDASLEAISMTAGRIDLEYLRKLKAVDDMSPDELGKIAVAPDDGPMLNAVIARIEKLAKEDPVAAAELRVTLTKNEPQWDKIEQKLFEQQVPIAGAGKTGVKPTYLQDIQQLTTGNNLAKFSLLNAGDVGSLLKGELRQWISSFSYMKKVRESFLDAFTTGPGHRKYGTSEQLIKEIQDGYNSASSKAFREAMMQHADANGNVYLLRGLKQKAQTSNILESFTTFAEKGDEFAKGGQGSTKFYKVAVKDIYGIMRDEAGGAAGMGKSVEILVLAHGRESFDSLGQIVAKEVSTAVEEVPKELLHLANLGIEVKGLKLWDKQNIKTLSANLWKEFVDSNPQQAFKGTAEEYEAAQKAYLKAGIEEYIADVNKFNSAKEANTGVSKSAAGYQDLRTALDSLKQQNVLNALLNGMPAETVSLRFNVPLDAVKLMQAGKSWQEATSTIGNSLYKDATQVEQYLAAEQRSVAVGTTSQKIPVAEIRSNLFKNQLDSSDAAIKDYILQGSSSRIARSIGDFLADPIRKAQKSALLAGLENITPAHLGSKFFQSTDFVLRDMGEVGKVLSTMGKDATHLYNKATNEIVKPISETFAAITKDPAAVLEFNTARELNASLQGYREFRNGKFWVQSRDEPFIEVTDAAGVVRRVRNMEEAMWRGQTFEVRTPSVLAAFEEMNKAGREMYAMNSTYRKILGQQALNDLGFWMPAFNPRNKFMAYALDTSTGATRLVWGHTPEELKTAKDALWASLTPAEQRVTKLVDKGLDQQLYNKLQGRHDEMFMQVADIGAFHSGASAQAMVPTNTNAFSELANAYEHYMHKSIASMLEVHYSDVMGQLDKMSVFARQATEGQPVGFIQKAINAPVDAGMVAKNTLLGRSDLNQYVGWQTVQNGIQMAAEATLQTLTKVMDPFINPAKGLFGRGKSASDKAFDALYEESIARNIPWPFEGLDQAVARDLFHVDRISQAPNLTPRLVALSNNLAATLLLKVMELGQPLVNMLSLPVLTSAAAQQQFAKSFMGAELKPGFQFGTTKLMYSGIRYMGHPEYQKYKKMGQELGIFEPVVSEVSELLQMTRSFNPGVMQKIENALSSKTVEMLSKPSNWSERATREFSFANGVYLAKQAYPGLSDAGVMTFARNFVDTAVGNYNAAQRPTMFQGTMGTAMGLFQTYMVTLAQQIYRRLELRDYKSLMKMMLTQSTIFGAKGLPGFNTVSELIGEHFSDQNWDLTTGAYRALPEPAADLILYGLPSNLGPAVYTRGDIQPRLPNIAGGLQNLAAINILQQAYDSGSKLAKAAVQIGQPGSVAAMAEALSMQSISRPVARVSELFTGHAVTRQGNEVAGPDEIYSVPGVLARVFATRGLQEAKAREAMHLNSMYGSLDREARQEAVSVLANHVRSGTLSPEILERVQEKYMRTGSPTGWRSAINKVMHDTDAPGVSAVRNHLRPSAPAQRMLDDMD